MLNKQLFVFKLVLLTCVFIIIIYTLTYNKQYNHVLKIGAVTDLKNHLINKFSQLKSFDKLELSNNHDKWIVVTSINEPSEQCKKLAKINGYKLLVIGDLKSNNSWNLNNSIFLSTNEQKELNFKTYSTTPFNSYTRKNLGYLYAIKYGAKFIYDTDDDNAPIVDLNSYFSYESYDYGLIYDCRLENKVLNPYAHFGQPNIWPRGYPLSEIEEYHVNSYISGRRKVSIVQQGVVNGDPDVDAIYRLTNTVNSRKINIEFDNSAPSIQLPLFKLTPYNSQNTLISYNGFWSLYLPKTVSFRVTDIWRSYWAQRLMWLLNETITFNGPNAYQLRNAHSYLKDFHLETDLYMKTEKFIDFLFEWKCSHTIFYDCILDLSRSMAEKLFWEKDEVQSVQNWLDDLINIGYNMPKMVFIENNNQSCSAFKIGPFEYTRVRYTPKFQKSIDYEKHIESYDDKLDTIKYFKNLCDRQNVSLYPPLHYLDKNSSSKSQVNYSLLITFNHEPIEENLIIIKHLFSSYFQNIVFCGIKLTSKLKDQKAKYKRFDSFTFIDQDTLSGQVHYYCMAKAIEMNFNTDGFLLMSDDVLLKYWNLNNLDPNKIWFPFDLIMRTDVMPYFNHTWFHWNREVGARASKKSIEQIKNISIGAKEATESEKQMAIQFMKNFDANQIEKSQYIKLSIRGSDMFYLPKRFFNNFLFAANIFRKYNSFLELAVTALLAGLDQSNQAQILNGSYTWGGAQFNFKDYNSTFHFHHPFKLSKLKVEKINYDFCNLYLRDLFQHI